MGKGNLKRKIFIKVLITLVLTAVTIFYFSTQSENLEKLQRKDRKIQVKANELKSRFDNFDKRKAEIKEALNTWLTLSENEKGLEGLKISKMKNNLDELKDIHDLNRLDINMSKPEIVKKGFRTKHIEVEASKIRLRVLGYSDIQIMFFLYDLVRSSPGYIDIRNLSVEREYILNETSFLNLAADINFSPVSAEVLFVWQELKNR